MSRLIDSFGRVALKLRLSVTDRCNFRCVYCMPEDVAWMERSQLLSFEELERVARIAVSLGVENIRLTGGEPLARRNLPELVERLARIEGLKGLSLTTNGVFLPAQGEALRRAGLKSLNVSLDSLDRKRFEQLVRRDALDQVLAGLDSARNLGFESIKINCVVMKGINECELIAFAKMSRETPFQVRFIEFMPLDGDNIWDRGKVVSLQEILDRISAVYPLDFNSSSEPHEPARTYRFLDGQGSIGVIGSVSAPFCSTCDRIRITSDGKFRTCLFSTKEVDLRGRLRDGSPDKEIVLLLLGAVSRKEAGHLINSPDFEKPERTMHAIGG